MKKVYNLSILILVLNCTTNEHLDRYTLEIADLKTESQKDAYWNTLYHLDQTTYLKETKGAFAGDSISLTNMMQTALMFEIHGTEVYTINNAVPILNFTHNYIGDSNLAFWPIILECQRVGGVIEQAGGGFPAYQLEGLSMSFYDYSLSNKASEYSRLVKKLNTITYSKVSSALAEIFKEQKDLSLLKEINILGQWIRQPIANFEDGGTFEFVYMSDENLYLRRKHRLQKLISLSEKENTTLYRIENEPFGWTYKLDDKSLSLIDDLNNTLITYNTY